MKKTLLATVLLLFVFCGQKQEATKVEPDKIVTKEVAVQILTEDELSRFLKVFPIFKAEAEKKNIEWTGINPKGDVLSQTSAYMKANKNLADIDARLRAAGMSLNEFWPVLVKTTMVFSAVMWDSAMQEAKKEMEKSKKELAEMEAKLKDPKISEIEKSTIKMALEASKALMEGMGSIATIYDSIPAANKMIVKQHFNELKTIFEVKD